MARDLVIVDYGHGGIYTGTYQTSGKQYHHISAGLWVGEGIVNRCVAARLIRWLLRAGVDVFDCVAGKEWHRAPSWLELTQQDVPLSHRVARANEVQRERVNSPLISVHANALSRTSTGDGQPHRGISLWTSPGETRSDGLARDLWWALVTYDGHGMQCNAGRDGQKDHESSFAILTRTVGPAVLIEGGFFDNLEDARIMISSQGQRSLAYAYHEGIMRWLRRQRAAIGGGDGI